ncbi:MAG TPA: site-specific DNA-methyltransferase, partial [Anaerolineae bacterium]|nr:site-specific DNA-methyltransferase [Anaerolineae bacterium]
MPITKLHPTFTFDEDRLAQLRAVVPEAFADGRINWETLRAALGEHLEDDEADAEHFGLFWPGKRAARRLASQPSRGTLVPQPGLGVNEATTRHLFIEGDNLEVLKLLLKSYAGQVKLIYIDPPYNTGNDFIYSDDFTEPLEAYLRRTGQVDEAGQPLTTNPKASGRFHSNWLNMMYPRLLLARQLLREDGVIFVSIDDNEVYHLRQMMNEIFGDENFVAQLVWKKKYTGGKHTSFYVDMHEYVLVYARAREIIAGFTIERPEEQKEKFEYSDEYESERGKYYVRPLKSNLASRPTLVYPIELPDGTVIETQWLVSRVTFDRMVEEGRIEFRQKRNGEYQVYKKYYERDDEGRVKVPSFIEGISNNDAKQELKELFGITEGRDNVFYTVKPTTLIKYLFRPFIGEDDIIMDFFAGSASTAHATLALDQEDGGNRRFIMVQLPEPTGNLTYPTIADIGRERIRRVIARMQAEAAGQETT